MTVKELKEKIKDFPDNMDVMIEQTNEEYRFAMADTVVIKSIRFYTKDIPKTEWPIIECVVLKDI